jgi:preprotein translocase SecE subunit
MPAFEVHRPDHAVTSRWILAASAFTLVLFGCYQLFYTLPEGARDHISEAFRPLGPEFPVSWALVVSIVLTVAGAYATWRAANHPRLVEFFGETEVEMTKVSWSSRREVIGSSLVVIATVVILGVWISAVDVILSRPWGTWITETLNRLFGGK